MSEHVATVRWARTTPDFVYDTYDRGHLWQFDGGIAVQASAAPGFLGNPACVDPEEALVASLSACHMLTFLAIAARRRLVVDRYEDEAAGVMTRNEAGKLWVSRVTLRPRIAFAGNPPDSATIMALHDAAHANCFIANSVRTEIVIEPRS